MQNQAFYRTGIFGNFFFGGGEFCVFKTGIPGGPDPVLARVSVCQLLSFSVPDVKCGLLQINKHNRANVTHGPSPVQKYLETDSKRCWTGKVQDHDLDLN